MYKKKKCFPCKHGNPPCCLLLLYLKKHVVQLSTSVRTMFFLFNVFILFIECLLLPPHEPETFTRFHTDFVSATFSTFLSPSCILLYNSVHRFSYMTTVENDHDNVLRVFLFFILLFFFFIWCHFVYLECF